MPELAMRDPLYLSKPFTASEINKSALIEVGLFHIAIAALLFHSWTPVTQHEPVVKTVNIRMVELPQPVKKAVIEEVKPVVILEPVIEPKVKPKQSIVENELAFKRVEKPIAKPIEKTAPKTPVKKKIEKQIKPLKDKPVPPVSQPTKQEKPAEKLPESPVLASSNEQNVPQKTQSNLSELATETFSVEHYKPIEKQVPDYPRGALRKGLEGDCTVRYTVNKQGRVESPVVLADCHPMFERPSLAAAKTFRYAPRMVNGKAVPVPNVRNTFEYRIH